MNPLYQSLNSNQNGSILDLFGGPQQFQQRLNSFAQDFMRNNAMTPEQKVRQMISSGQMSQAQFERLRAVANQITGMNF